MGGQMNPAMMQQMQNMMGGMNRQTGSPNPQGQMNPAMMQQMQMQQMQHMQQQQPGAGFGGNQNMMNSAGQRTPGFNAQDQLAFEQQKYEQRSGSMGAGRMAGGFGPAGPTSWEGMYDEVPQPNIPSGPSGGRSGSVHSGRGGHSRGRQGSSQPPTQPSNAPLNAPTGPKNAGKPGANYRGGGRNTNYRHNPYGHGRG
jgi:RNA-binding protein Musashi